MTLSNQSKELLEQKMQLKNTLAQVLPADIVSYIIELLVKDQAHENYLRNIGDR